MTTVINSSQSPYAQAFLPLPLEAPHSTLKKILTAVNRVFSSVLFFPIVCLSGITVSLVCLSVKIEAIYCIGVGILLAGVALVGWVNRQALLWLNKDSVRTIQYRLQLLNSLERESPNAKIGNAFADLKKILGKSLTQFTQSYENHTLHDRITFLTESMSWNRLDLIKSWRSFLHHLDKKQVLNSDGNFITLDFSTEIGRLEGRSPELKEVEFLGPLASAADLQQLEQIQLESFGKRYTFTKEQIKETLTSGRGHCAVIRQKESREILGFAWTSKEKEGNCLVGLARKPGAARLGIGEKLLSALLEKLEEGEPLHLQVRQSNQSARALYESFGFVERRTLPGYYADPQEDAEEMQLDWNLYRQRNLLAV